MNNTDEERIYNPNIKFVSQQVYGLLQEFKNEMNKMEELEESIISENDAVKNDWHGDASDTTLKEIDKLKYRFEEIEAQNQKYVDSLYKIIDNYAYEEKTNENKVNDNVGAFDFTWQKGA